MSQTLSAPLATGERTHLAAPLADELLEARGEARHTLADALLGERRVAEDEARAVRRVAVVGRHRMDPDAGLAAALAEGRRLGGREIREPEHDVEPGVGAAHDGGPAEPRAQLVE